MVPRIGYATTSDDVAIAYWAHGSGPVLVQGPLVPFSHIELEWQNPHIRGWYERMGEMVTLVRYDARGNGLSQRDVEDVSFEGHIRDLEAVVEAVGAETLCLMGVFHSGPPIIEFAARNPQLVSSLILWCSYGNGADYWKASQSEGLRALRQTDYDLFLRTSSHELIGWEDDDEAEAYAAVMAEAVHAQEADRLITATRGFDAMEAAGAVECPTLVMHRRGLHWIGVDLSRALASRIPGARLTIVDGRSPLPGAGAMETAVREIGSFLDVETRLGTSTPLVMKAVLFTDLVEHTRMMTAVGDDLGREVLRHHEEITRSVLLENGGTEVKALGDGFMASFTSVTQAVRCAITLQQRFDAWNSDTKADRPALGVRIGVNAGEPIEEDGDLFGASVILAARIAAQATQGEILVSNTVRDLTLGKNFAFSSPREVQAKGFEEPVRVWSVDWRG
jgi:class 3 adenylate cyclase/pimeloyl-ACP methyl ester carboxylesterase